MTDFEYETIVLSGGSCSKAIHEDDNDDDDDDDLDNSCSICLEPFNTDDPPTVTSCRHEYHLQCILEWSQRRTECPICWQLLVLKDPASQELLAAMEIERNLRSKHSEPRVHEDYNVNNDAASYEDNSDFEARIIRHFAAAARSARFISRRGREISSRIGPSQVSHSVPHSNVQQTHMSPELQRSSDESSDGDSPTFGHASPMHPQYIASSIPEVLNVEPRSPSETCSKSSCHLPETTQRPSSSEFSAFSDSFKSKFSAASARYKESISKGTRGFKEKLLARNISVKELGKGVQREMNAGIAGVAKIIDCLDLASKRNGVSVHLSSCTRGSSDLSSEKNDELPIIVQHEEEKAHVVGSAVPSHLQSTISSKLEVLPVEGGN